MKIMRRFLLSICLLILLTATTAVAQVKTIRDSDRREIIERILRSYNFGPGRPYPFQSIATTESINIEQGSIPHRLLRKLKSTSFTMVSDGEIVRQQKLAEGIIYYSFSGFNRRKGRIRVSFSETHTGPTYGSGHTKEYSFYRVAGKWRFKSWFSQVWIAEG